MSQPKWLSYSHADRVILMAHFNLKKSLPTEVVGNQLVHDGIPPINYYEIDDKEADKVLEANKQPQNEQENAKEEVKKEPAKKKRAIKKGTRSKAKKK